MTVQQLRKIHNPRTALYLNAKIAPAAVAAEAIIGLNVDSAFCSFGWRLSEMNLTKYQLVVYYSKREADVGQRACQRYADVAVEGVDLAAERVERHGLDLRHVVCQARFGICHGEKVVGIVVRLAITIIDVISPQEGFLCCGAFFGADDKRHGQDNQYSYRKGL